MLASFYLTFRNLFLRMGLQHTLFFFSLAEPAAGLESVGKRGKFFKVAFENVPTRILGKRRSQPSPRTAILSRLSAIALSGPEIYRTVQLGDAAQLPPFTDCRQVSRSERERFWIWNLGYY